MTPERRLYLLQYWKSCQEVEQLPLFERNFLKNLTVQSKNVKEELLWKEYQRRIIQYNVEVLELEKTCFEPTNNPILQQNQQKDCELLNKIIDLIKYERVNFTEYIKFNSLHKGQVTEDYLNMIAKTVREELEK